MPPNAEVLLTYVTDAAAFARELLGWTPDAKQTEVLQSTARRVILNCSRQWGKTTVAVTKVLHMLLMREGTTALIICENLGQTSEFFAKLDEFLEQLEIPIRGEKGKRLGRRLPNGSRVIGLAAREGAVRGYTADFVFLDEASRIRDEVIDALGPVVAVRNGDWWMASTPQGMRGRFWELWIYGEGADLLRVSVPWQENPRMSGAFIDKMRHDKGDAYVQQEMECQFVENGVYLVSTEAVDELVVPLKR